MPRERGRRLRTQLLAWLIGPLALLLAAEAAWDLHSARDFSRRAFDKALVELARDVALHVGGSPAEPRLQLDTATVALLLEDPTDRVSFAVLLADGRMVEGTPIPAAAPARSARAGSTLYDAQLDGREVRVAEVAGPVSLAGLRVRVAETTVKREELAREIAVSALLPQAVTVLLMILVVWIGVDRGLAPVEDLQRALAERSHLDRSPLPEGELPTELRPLVHSINGVLERLDHVLTLQTRFIADAAHQLKTPVAGLKAQAELLLREHDAASRREVAGRLYVGAERLSRIVSQLLSLARNDPDAARAQSLQPLDLEPFVLEITQGWVPQAIKSGIDLGFEGCESPAIVHADPQSLSDMLDNLLDNAIRYSRWGGRVTVRVAAGAQPSFSVSDDAPRIPPEERERVFERFHRLREGDGEGSGLGLAIVREIARVHGAEVAVAEDGDGEGNRFTVTFASS
jgi:two-component system sensor histidine kinase TctE